mmetsp:Transcript_46145/g.131668  ORF Transcript_46145/g.131668 Transcript_46145/m.131668 type:complete len:217 (+) Transcript_46145:180-830(+)
MMVGTWARTMTSSSMPPQGVVPCSSGRTAGRSTQSGQPWTSWSGTSQARRPSPGSESPRRRPRAWATTPPRWSRCRRARSVTSLAARVTLRPRSGQRCLHSRAAASTTPCCWTGAALSGCSRGCQRSSGTTRPTMRGASPTPLASSTASGMSTAARSSRPGPWRAPWSWPTACTRTPRTCSGSRSRQRGAWSWSGTRTASSRTCSGYFTSTACRLA